jgi:hypothetical protein
MTYLKSSGTEVERILSAVGLSRIGGEKCCVSSGMPLKHGKHSGFSRLE